MNQTPSGKRSDASDAAAIAKRVFPTPPGPVTVTIGAIAQQPRDVEDLLASPHEGVRRNRQVRPEEAPQRRKILTAELKDALGGSEVSDARQDR